MRAMGNWIVLVDDDLDMHYIYRKVFFRLGLGDLIQLFESGEEALNFLADHSCEVRIIFSDVNMPSMDGLEFRRRIARMPECKSIPFIFLSTSAREREVAQAYDLMVQGFFQKGLTINEIEKSISGALDYWGKCLRPAVCPPVAIAGATL